MSDVDLERRLAAALRTPLSSSARARERVMERVREASRKGMPRRRTIAMPALSPRGVRQSIVGVALAASIGSITALSALVPAHGASSGGATSGVIGDTVVATLRDTLRLVRLIFDDPSARRVAVVGDFNDWSADATPLRRDRSPHRWSAVVAMRDGEHRYAFVVDGTRWVPDPAVAVVRGDDGRLYTLLHVARASN
jgi:hypothetical protein